MKPELREALAKPFGPEAVKQKKGQGGRLMDYVSHGMVMKRLNDAAPDWSAEMVERWITDTNGALHCVGGVMRLTIDGVTREEAGGPTRLGLLADDLKNTYSDCLKRCAMRFGVALDMWESAEENDEDAQPAAPEPANQSAPLGRTPSPPPTPTRPAVVLVDDGGLPPHLAAVHEALQTQADRQTPEGAIAWLMAAQTRADADDARKRCKDLAIDPREFGPIYNDVTKRFRETG